MKNALHFVSVVYLVIDKLLSASCALFESILQKFISLLVWSSTPLLKNQGINVQLFLSGLFGIDGSAYPSHPCKEANPKIDKATLQAYSRRVFQRKACEHHWFISVRVEPWYYMQLIILST